MYIPSKRLLSQVRGVKVTLSCLVVFYSFSCYVVFHSLNAEGEQSQLKFTVCYILHTQLLFLTCNKRNHLYVITIIYFILLLNGDVFKTHSRFSWTALSCHIISYTIFWNVELGFEISYNYL